MTAWGEQIVPVGSNEGGLILRLSPDSGQPLAQAPTDAAPAGINPARQHLSGRRMLSCLASGARVHPPWGEGRS